MVDPERAAVLAEVIDAGASRWPAKLEREFRAFLKSDEAAKGDYENLGRAYESQRAFKKRWLESEHAAASRQLIHDEVTTDIQASRKTFLNGFF